MESFANPEWFWAFLLIPILIVLYYFKEVYDNVDFKFSSSEGFGKTSSLVYLKHIPFLCLQIGLIAFIVALARPQDSKSWEETKTQGIDMIISMDISSSMKMPDFKPSRFDASKKIATEFIQSRPNDRFGLVVFAAESFTQCPLTIDHNRITELFQDIRMGILEDGTAIGSGLATAVQRLKDSEAKSKVIVLLTDGENNAGEISPKTAAELANTYDIKVYTIGIGKKKFTIQQKDFFGRTYNQQIESKIDTESLEAIAKITGGRYYRAESPNALKNIYEEIDQLEKTELASLKYYKKTELFLPYVLVGLILLGLGKSLELTVFKTID
ncbi:MAG: aerotolerance regulator BatA [Flavobacteriales bacterium]|nr:aerotolerance regulator BatA [Flavobacteriales bacterium]